VSTDPSLAFNTHGCVESGLGLADDNAIIILVSPWPFLLRIININEPSRDKSGLLELYKLLPSVLVPVEPPMYQPLRHYHRLFTKMLLDHLVILAFYLGKDSV
jgi:hypothetical protein